VVVVVDDSALQLEQVPSGRAFRAAMRNQEIRKGRHPAVVVAVLAERGKPAIPWKTVATEELAKFPQSRDKVSTTLVAVAALESPATETRREQVVWVVALQVAGRAMAFLGPMV
jgi:hypothetical protein